MGTTLWYCVVKDVEPQQRKMRIWLCRWYADEVLPCTHAFFAFLLHEIFEYADGNMMNLELETCEAAPDEIQEIETQSFDASKFIETVEMVRWCGLNEPVDDTKYPCNKRSDGGSTPYNIQTNNLQAEFVITVTDAKYLPRKAHPSPIAGNLHFSSTAYDMGNREVGLGQHISSIIHPREEFLLQTSHVNKISTKMIGRDPNVLPIKKLLKELNFMTNVTTRCSMRTLREHHQGIMFHGARSGRLFMDLASLDRTAMVALSTNKLLEYIQNEMLNAVYDVLEPSADGGNVARAKELKRQVESVVSISLAPDVYLTPNLRDAMKWMVTFVKKSNKVSNATQLVDVFKQCVPE